MLSGHQPSQVQVRYLEAGLGSLVFRTAGHRGCIPGDMITRLGSCPLARCRHGARAALLGLTQTRFQSVSKAS
jgi:hypothetical protein